MTDRSQKTFVIGKSLHERVSTAVQRQLVRVNIFINDLGKKYKFMADEIFA